MRSLLLFAVLAVHVFAVSLPASGDIRRQGIIRTRQDDDDAQESLTLDPDVIADGFENDGLDNADDGVAKSLTSSNNFINFCLTRDDLPITNGKQIAGGSCNPAPMGLIASTDNMPSAKFVNPPNLGTIEADKAFTVEVAIKNLATGHFTNPDETYYAAPQQLDNAGRILGHSHIVIEELDSLEQTTATNPKNFVFFKGLNDAARGGVLTTEVEDGLPEGFYRISTINSAANHQPVLVAVAQRGALDDAVYVRHLLQITSLQLVLINLSFGSSLLSKGAGRIPNSPVGWAL